MSAHEVNIILQCCVYLLVNYPDPEKNKGGWRFGRMTPIRYHSDGQK